MIESTVQSTAEWAAYRYTSRVYVEVNGIWGILYEEP